MLQQALGLAQAVATRRLSLLGGHFRARATHVLLLAAFSLSALVFLLTLATLALARWIGTLQALGVMAAICLAGALIVLLLMRAEARRHAALMARQAERDNRLVQAALLSAAPTVLRGGGGLLAAGAGLLTAITLFRRSRRQRGDRHND